jgi:hypothetical protein
MVGFTQLKIQEMREFPTPPTLKCYKKTVQKKKVQEYQPKLDKILI